MPQPPDSPQHLQVAQADSSQIDHAWSSCFDTQAASLDNQLHFTSGIAQLSAGTQCYDIIMHLLLPGRATPKPLMPQYGASASVLFSNCDVGLNITAQLVVST